MMVYVLKHLAKFGFIDRNERLASRNPFRDKIFEFQGIWHKKEVCRRSNQETVYILGFFIEIDRCDA
jgi:hypothetical protein